MRTYALPILAALSLPLFFAACPPTTDTENISPSDMSPSEADTEAPTVTISDDVAGVADGDITFTFTFSEDVGDSFVADDVTLDMGSKGAFNSDGMTATLVVTPPSESAGTLQVDVAAGAFEDLAGNANTEAASATQDFDTQPPAVDTVIMDFEDPAQGLEPFGGIAASVITDPEDATNQVAEIVKNTGTQFWSGATMHYCPAFGITVLPLSATDTTMSMRVWSPDAGIPIRLKVENSGDPTVSVETETMTTMASAWETLVFDFSNEVGGTAALNPASTYDKMSVFPNFGTDGNTAGDKTYYVDDVMFLGQVFTPDCP